MALPSGYIKLEYIESTGTQYINTGVSAPEGMRVECQAEFTSLRSGLNMLFGSHDAADPYYRNYLAANSAGNWELGAYGVATFGAITTGRKYSIDVCTISGDIFAKIDGMSYYIGDIAPPTKRSSLSVYLFALHYAGGLLWASAKLYGAKIYLNASGSNPTRDFIPCKNAFGVVGMWDDVNGQFYTNVGTGAFTAGPETKPNLTAHKTLINGTAYTIKGGKCMVNGTVYNILKGRTLIDGTGYDITLPSAGTKLSTLDVGHSVFANVNGKKTEFLVVHQGLPSSRYDDSCNGTWLLMKDIYENRMWGNWPYNNDYANSTIHPYLNSTFLNLFDSNIQKAIKQVKIPYRKDGGPDGTDQSGANGLSCKVFLLSCYEVGLEYSYFPVEGAKLDYFESGTDTSANNKRIAYLNGSPAYWWLRSPNINDTKSAYVTTSYGSYNSYDMHDRYGIRPALVLPSDALVDDEFNLIA